MRAWTVRAARLLLSAAVVLAVLDAAQVLRGLPSTYADWAGRSLTESRQRLNGEEFLALLEAARRALPAPGAVALWVPHSQLAAMADLVQAADRWMRAAYLLYPDRVVPLSSTWVLSRLGAIGFLDPAAAADLARRYLPLGGSREPLAIVAFAPRLPERLESLLVDQTGAAGDVALGEGVVIGQTVEVPAPARLSSVDVDVREWSGGMKLRLALRDASDQGGLLESTLQRGSPAGRVARFVFGTPPPLSRGARVRLEVTSSGPPGGVVRLRGRPEQLWLQVFAAEPGVQPVAVMPGGTVFVARFAAARP
jgi:hypothetical protein